MKEQELRLLTVLTEIYNKTQEPTLLSLTNTLKKNNIKYVPQVTKIIKDNFIYYKPQGTGTIIKWTSIKPNLKMVERVMQEIEEFKKVMSERTKEYKNNLKKEVIKIETPKSEIDIMYGFLKELYSETKHNAVKFSIQELAETSGIRNRNYINTALKECYLIHSTKFHYVFWQAKAPTMKTAEEVIDKALEITRRRNRKPSSKKEVINESKTSGSHSYIFGQDNELKPVELLTVEKPKEYKKEIKLFGFTIYSKTIK